MVRLSIKKNRTPLTSDAVLSEIPFAKVATSSMLMMKVNSF
jgi:hypothetical protein